MRKAILAGVSSVAIALGGCSMFHSGQSDQSAAAPPARPASGPMAQMAPSPVPANAATETAAAPKKLAKNDEVKLAQQKLQAEGLYKGKIDGIDGPKTRQALNEYQKQHGLKPTGRLDQNTLAQLTGDQTSGAGSSVPPGNAPHTPNGAATTPGATPPGK